MILPHICCSKALMYQLKPAATRHLEYKPRILSRPARYDSRGRTLYPIIRLRVIYRQGPGPDCSRHSRMALAESSPHALVNNSTLIIGCLTVSTDTYSRLMPNTTVPTRRSSGDSLFLNDIPRIPRLQDIFNFHMFYKYIPSNTPEHA